MDDTDGLLVVLPDAEANGDGTLMNVQTGTASIDYFHVHTSTGVSTEGGPAA
jgi:hypothetical protein